MVDRWSSLVGEARDGCQKKGLPFPGVSSRTSGDGVKQRSKGRGNTAVVRRAVALALAAVLPALHQQAAPSHGLRRRGRRVSPWPQRRPRLPARSRGRR